MLKNILLIFLISLFLSGCNKADTYNPDTYFLEAEKKELLLKIIPYSAKLPKGYNYKSRFEPKLDSFYSREIKKYSIEYYYLSTADSFHYFMLSRVAPSFYEKRISIGGKFKKDNQGNIHDYEECFWTFKMKKEELYQKGSVLFDQMVKGGDLSPYFPGRKEGEWIEFPDDRIFYDKQEKRWRMKPELSALSHQWNK